MTNELAILSILVTNWATVELTIPKVETDKSLSKQTITKRIGVVSSNQVARVVLEGTTNELLISSEIISVDNSLIKDAPAANILYFTNAVPKGSWIFQ